MYGSPCMIAQSAGLTPAARTRISTWSSPMAGLSMSRASTTSPEPYLSCTMAFIAELLSVAHSMRTVYALVCTAYATVYGVRCQGQRIGDWHQGKDED